MDALAVLQTEVTKTSTFNGSGYDLLTGTPRRGLWAQVRYKAAKNSSGDNDVVFSIEHSDNDSDYYLHTSGAADTIALSTSEKDGFVYLPINTDKRYVRLTATISGQGSGATITYSGHLLIAKP